MLLYYLLSLIIVLILLIYCGQRWKLYFCSLKLPGPIAWPIIGNVLLCIGNAEALFNTLLNLKKYYNTPYRAWLGNKLIVAISEPEDMEIVLSKCMEKEPTLAKLLSPIVGNGLITAMPSPWKQHRKLLARTFNQKILNNFVPTFNEHSRNLVHNLRHECGKSTFDIMNYISPKIVDFVCETTMGIQMGAQTRVSNYGESLRRALATVFERYFQFWLYSDWIFYRTAKGNAFVKDVKVVHDFCKQVMKRKSEEFYVIQKENIFQEQSFSPRKAFLEYILELRETRDDLTDEEIFDELNTFMAAGTDTLASALGFICMILGRHPEIQEKAHLEVLEAFNNGDEITAETVIKLPYLEQVIKETLRIFPTIPVSLRISAEDIQLKTCVIPKGVAICHVTMNTHRDPKLYKNPLEFDPDRFLPDEQAKRHPFAYLPFGAGPRNCIGFAYAKMAMKVVMAHLLKNFKLKSDLDIENIRLENNVVLKPVLGFNVQIELRSL